MLDDTEMVIRVRAELLGVVVQRCSYASEHAVQVRGVAWVMVDPDRDILPPRFVHRVLGGEEGVLVADRAIGHVVVVAAPALRPRPAQRPRRYGDLVLLGAHHRFERDPAAPILPRFDVVERGDQPARREPVRPPVCGARELASALIADRGQPNLVGEVGAVRHHGGVDSSFTEAMRLDMHREVEPQRVAGLERPLQGIDPVAEVLVGEHLCRRSVEGYRSGLDTGYGSHVDGVDCHGVAVHQAVQATDIHLPPLGMDLDVQIDTRQVGLRDTRVPPVAPLVLGGLLRPVGRGLVRIQHVRVVEDERADREDHGRGRPDSQCRRTREATPRQSKPDAESPFPTPHPEQPRHHREQQRPRRPIELEPSPGHEGRAKAAHIGVGPTGTGAVDEQVVVDSEHGGESDEYVGDDRHRVTDVLLVHQRMHHEGEQREEEVFGKLKPNRIFRYSPSSKS